MVIGIKVLCINEETINNVGMRLERNHPLLDLSRAQDTNVVKLVDFLNEEEIRMIVEGSEAENNIDIK